MHIKKAKGICRETAYLGGKYLQLLTAALPRIIETPEGMERANKVIEPFLHPERSLAPEEEAFVRLMFKLIDDYNQAPPAFPPLKPHKLL